MDNKLMQKIENVRKILSVFGVNFQKASELLNTVSIYHKGSITFQKVLQRIVDNSAIPYIEKMFMTNFYGYIQGFAEIKAMQYKEEDKKKTAYMVAEELIESNIEQFKELSKMFGQNSKKEMSYIG